MLDSSPAVPAMLAGLALAVAFVAVWPPRQGRMQRLHHRRVAVWPRWPTRLAVTALDRDALEIAAALQAGLDFDEAVAGLAAIPPWSQFVSLRRAGLPLLEAIDQSIRLQWPELATVLVLHNQYGGPLADMLLALADATSRRRMLVAEMRARTSEARASALLLGATGPSLGLYMLWREPDLLAPLFGHPFGVIALIFAGLLWAAGLVIIRRLLRPLQ